MEHEHETRPVEIKDLNKTQLILLALLLSFVTSIATGIVTVTLMEQAPTGVTQTINRVVQQTIEKVVPDYGSGKTQTVVIKEDDLVVNVIRKTRVNIFVLYGDKDAKAPVAHGYSLGGGMFLTASVDTASVYFILVGKETLEAKVIGTSDTGFSLLSAAGSEAVLKTLPKSAFGKDADSKAGQTVVIVGADAVAKGLVQSAPDQNAEASVSAKLSIVPAPTAETIGDPVVNLDGNVVGFVASRGEFSAQVLGIDAIAAFANPPVIPLSASPNQPLAP